MHAVRNTLLLLLAAAWALTVPPTGVALAAAGNLDPTFGGDGKVTTNFTDWLDFARAVAVQPDGKIVAAGRTGFAARRFGLARYEPDGSLDPTFGGDGKVTTNFTDGSDSAAAVAIQPDGRIVAAGGAAEGGGVFALARYEEDGDLDTTFGEDGRVTTNFSSGGDGASGVAIQPDGRIVAAGVAGGGEAFALARYEEDGDLDTTLGGDGRVTTAFHGFDFALAHAVALQPDGKIVLAGEAASGPGNGRFALARYQEDGTRDPSFGGNGKVTSNLDTGYEFADGVAIQPNGRIVAAGSTGEASGDPAFLLARYRADGTLDPTFSGDGKKTTNFVFGFDIVHGVAIQADGRIVAGGSAGEDSSNPRFGLARYRADGTLDPTFGGDGKVTTDFTPGPDNYDIAWGVAIQPDGGIVAAGEAGTATANGGTFALARYLPA